MLILQIGSTLSRLLEKVIIKPRIWAILSIISTKKKVIIVINILKSYKTSIYINNFDINDWEKKNRLKNYIKVNTLYLVFYNL